MTGKDKFARPATLNDLKSLVKSLNENGVDYLLIGGYALFAHGYQRATTDIDIVVRPSKQEGEKIKQALMVLPDKVAAELDVDWFEDGETIRVADEIVVDLMFSACGETFETLNQYAQTLDLDGIPLKTISLQGLLLTKQTVREKDISDRLILEKAIRILNEQGKP